MSIFALWVSVSGCCGDHGCCGDVRGYGTGGLVASILGTSAPWRAEASGVGGDVAAFDAAYRLLLDNRGVPELRLAHPGAMALMTFDPYGERFDFVVAARMDAAPEDTWAWCGEPVRSLEVAIARPSYPAEFWMGWTGEAGVEVASWSGWSDGVGPWEIHPEEQGRSGHAWFTPPPTPGCPEPTDQATVEVAWAFDEAPDHRDRSSCGW